MRTIRHLISGVVALTAATAPLFAQNGDKAGEVQAERVPAELIPPAPVLSPEEALAGFRVAPGFKVELVAAEPLVQSPVQAQFDHQGRLWVVEMTGYMPNPEGTGEQEPNGNIVILEDTDADGRMDKRTVFLGGLVMPRAVMLVADGALIAEPPTVWFARDTDGDGKADDKVVAFTGYATQNDPQLGAKSNPEHASNSLTWALDNWVYSANHTTRYRWTGDPEVWTAEGTIFRGQWGLSQDDFGRLFYNSNSDQLRADFVPDRYLARNRHLRQPFGVNVQVARDQRAWPIRVNPGVNRGYQPNTLTKEGRLNTFTGACGPVVFRGDQFGADFVGDAYLCEPTANLVRRNRLTEKDGEFTADNAYEQAEFLASLDERFRPVNLHNGPDGALYVVDFYRGLIQHRIYLTSYLRKQIESRSLQSPVNLGRIWRVVREERPVKRGEVLPAKPTAEQLVAKLAHPNGFWRDTAQRMLVERGDQAVAPKLQALATDGNSPALARLHALWTLEGLGALDLATLRHAVFDADGKVRVAALRLTEGFLGGPQHDDAVNLIFQRAGFIPAEEQVQLFFTLGRLATPQADTIIRVLLLNTPPDRLRTDAALSSLGGRELEFLDALLKDPACNNSREGEHTALLSRLASCITLEARPDRVARLLQFIGGAKPGNWQQLALLDGVLGTLPPVRRGQPTPTVKPLVFPAEPQGLAALRTESLPALKERLERLDQLIVWPGKPGYVAPAAARPLTGEEQAGFNRGKELYAFICGACHQPHGNGQEGLAPPLVDSEWTTGSEQRLIRIVLHGLRDEITVKGQKWNLNMPAFGEAVDDQQIADVLTYVRREWGHTAEPVKAETVKVVRAATAGQEDSWTEAQLLRIK